MTRLTPAGLAAANDIANRTGFSANAVLSMLDSYLAGNGGMAQFNHPEFGGSGQWMRGGMVMIGDMFNNNLKYRVSDLCDQLGVFSQNNGYFEAATQNSPMFSGGGWWPGGYGAPNSTGAQNNVRYAYFAGARRLAVDIGGRVSVYDTLDHQIGGVSQQQSGTGSVTFTSQYGNVDLTRLPLVSTDGQAPPPQAFQPAGAGQPAGNGGEIIGMIEKLADLHRAGVLSDQEFSTKKAALLSRL
jgi:hypothetical protein